MPDPTLGRDCRTPGDWLAFAEREYARQGIALGQVATSAHDEALYLLLHTLGLPLDSGAAVLQRRLTPAEIVGVRRVLRRRLRDRVPAAYLTREAFPPRVALALPSQTPAPLSRKLAQDTPRSDSSRHECR